MGEKRYLLTAVRHGYPGLEIRVVLWPQSTKTSVGPPDNARWWSGGPVVYRKTHHKKKLIGTDHFYAFMSFSVYVMYCKDRSNALNKKR